MCPHASGASATAPPLRPQPEDLRLAATPDLLDYLLAGYGRRRWRGFDLRATANRNLPAACAVVAALDDAPTLLVAHHPPVSPSTHPVFGLVGGEAIQPGETVFETERKGAGHGGVELDDGRGRKFEQRGVKVGDLAPVGRGGFGGAAELDEGDAEAVVGVGKRGREREGSFEVRHGVGRAAQRLQVGGGDEALAGERSPKAVLDAAAAAYLQSATEEGFVKRGAGRGASA